MSVLRKRAMTAGGVDEEKMEGAEDDDEDPRGALISLIVESEGHARLTAAQQAGQHEALAEKAAAAAAAVRSTGGAAALCGKLFDTLDTDDSGYLNGESRVTLCRLRR